MMNGKLEILLVGDGANGEQPLERVLRRRSYGVTVAGSGSEALACIERRRPNLIIADTGLEGMDGHALCRAIKADPACENIPVVLLTESVRPSEVIEGLQAGADNFISRPYREESVLARIESILANRQLRSGRPETGVEVLFRGTKHCVPGDPAQIIDMLLSTCEEAGAKSAELEIVRKELGDVVEVVSKLTSMNEVVRSAQAGPDARKGAEILMAEDDQKRADKLGFALEEHGFRVTRVENGLLALEAARRRKPQLIVCNVLMPEMSGLELCRAVKTDATLGDVPVVLLATKPDAAETLLAVRAGADIYIARPYEEGLLLNRIDALLEPQAPRSCAGVDEETLAVVIDGRSEDLATSRARLVNLLLTSYQNTLKQNRDLSRVRDELMRTNAGLASEVAELKRAEKEMRRTHDELEARVWERGSELFEVNLALKNEVGERQRAETEARTHAARQSVLARLAHLTLTEIALRDFLHEVAHHTGLALGAQWFHVLERLPDGGTLVVRGLTGSVGEGQSLVVDERGLCGRPLLTNEVLIVDDLESEERRTLPPWLQGAEVRSAIVVPFELSGGLFGVLAAFSTSRCRFDLGAGSFLRGVGNLIGQFITRLRSEEQLRLRDSALQSAANAIVITDRESVIQWVNPAFTKLSGYTVAEAIGRTPRELLKSGRHDTAFYKHMWDTLLDGRIWEGDLVNRRKDQTLYTEHQTITPILGGDGRARHFICVKENITARLELEEQFRHSQKMEAVGRLAGGIAHDFNNQLFVINGYCELLAAAVAGNTDLEGPLQEIHAAARRSALLTKQLLAFSRKQVLQPKILNLATELSGIEDTLGRLIGETIELTIVSKEGTGHVEADPGQLQQVVMNLAVNARDAMPQGGKLTIECANVEFDEAYARSHPEVIPGRYVSLSVSDTGVGMDAATLERVFEPFFTTKGAGKGTGLGLPTVLGIVKQSGGHVAIRSQPGVGTELTIYLPHVEEEARTPAVEVPRPSAGGNETILYTEDEPALRRLVSRVLAERGYKVLEAGNGKEALEVARKLDGPIHLLLTDVIMPEMGGSQLAAQLAASRPEMRVIYTSGYTTDDILSHHGVLQGEHVLLTKPCPTDVLLRAVRGVLDARLPAGIRTGRILIVDDSQDERILAARLLSKSGFSVIQANSGKEALAALEREPVDAVITDVNMAGMDGFELTKAIRDQPRWLTLPVIMLTGACTDEEIEHSRAVGATACLDKGSTGPQGLIEALGSL